MNLGKTLDSSNKWMNKNIFGRFTSIQIIVFYYIVLTILAFVLFQLPFFRQPDSHVETLDLVFMAFSTTSVTGLSTFNIADVFNQNGVVLLQILFQVGGLGIMMISTFFAILSKRKVTLRQRQLIMTDMNQPRLSGVVRLIQRTFIIIFAIQILFGIGFGLYFDSIGRFSTSAQNLFWGMFESVSAVTNSGFDVSGSSLMPLAHDHLFLLVIMSLIAVGGIGFPVLLEITEWFFSRLDKRKRIHFRFSLFSKLALVSFIGLFLIGAFLIYLFERHHLFEYWGRMDSWMTAFFYSMSTRNAGLQMNPLTDFQPNTLLIFSVLMFIGASPSSVGGGIRTTTVVIVFLYVISFLKGEENVNIFGRQIDQKDVRKSVVVMYLSLLFCFIACLILMAVHPEFRMIDILVEVTSAFGTTGLSMGITPELETIGKVTLIVLMFVGRVGTLYMLMLFVPKQARDLGYKYPTEKIIIG